MALRVTYLDNGFPASDGEADVFDVTIASERTGPGRIDHRVRITASGGRSIDEIRFSVDAPFAVADLPCADAFLIAIMFVALQRGGTWRFHATASRTLLRSILDYQAHWVLGRVGHYRPFTLEVDSVRDAEAAPPARPRAILPFSAGMDSMLALLRHRSGLAGPASVDVRAALQIKGFHARARDLPDFERTRAHLAGMLGRWDIPLAIVETNLGQVTGERDDAHGTWLAACLTLFSGSFDAGLIGSSIRLHHIAGADILGSDPMTDRLLTGADMLIFNDEGFYDRVDKAAQLANFPEAADNLIVCWHPIEGVRNCCRCEKCVRSMLAFLAAGKAIPAAFPEGLDPGRIGVGLGRVTGHDMARYILQSARRYGTDRTPVMRALRRAVRRKAPRVFLRRLFGRART